MNKTIRINVNTCSNVKLTCSVSLSMETPMFGRTLASRASVISGALDDSYRKLRGLVLREQHSSALRWLSDGGAANASGVNRPSNSNYSRRWLIEGVGSQIYAHIPNV